MAQRPRMLNKSTKTAFSFHQDAFGLNLKLEWVKLVKRFTTGHLSPGSHHMYFFCVGWACGHMMGAMPKECTPTGL